MATSTITNTIKDASGTALSGVLVRARLRPNGGFRINDGSEITKEVTTTTNGSGVWSLPLEQQANINPSGSWYEVIEEIPPTSGGTNSVAISVGAANATLQASLVTPVPPTGLAAFLTQSAADARYAIIAALGDAVRYVSATNGDNNNDGLSWGRAKATIAAAVASLPAAGGTVYLSAGTHTVSAKVTNSGTVSNLRISGLGAATIVKAANGLNDHVFDLRGSNVIVEHLLIDGNTANQTPVGGDYADLYLTGVTNALVFDVQAKNANSHGIKIDNVGGAWTEARIMACVLFNNGTNTTIGNGICAIGGNQLSIDPTTVCQGNKGDGVYLQSVTNFNVDCLSQNNTGYGLELLTSVQYGTVRGVFRGNTESGIGADVIAVMDGVSFAGAVCELNGGAGIQIQSGSGNPTNLALLGAICKNNSQPGLARLPSGTTAANTRDGIELSGAKACVVVGNQCYDDQGTKTQRYAFSDGGGATAAIVAGNYFPDNRTGGMSLTGTGNIIGINFTATAVGAYSDDGHRAIVQSDNAGAEVLLRTSGGNDNYAARVTQSAAGAAFYLRGPAGETDVKIKRLAANVMGTDENFAVNTTGQGFRVKEGTNAKQGTATLVAGAVVVSTTAFTATSRIFVTSQVDGGTPGFLRVSARTAATSFTITSSNGADTSTVAWEIFEPA